MCIVLHSFAVRGERPTSRPRAGCCHKRLILLGLPEGSKHARQQSDFGAASAPCYPTKRPQTLCDIHSLRLRASLLTLSFRLPERRPASPFLTSPTNSLPLENMAPVMGPVFCQSGHFSSPSPSDTLNVHAPHTDYRQQRCPDCVLSSSSCPRSSQAAPANSVTGWDDGTDDSATTGQLPT